MSRAIFGPKHPISMYFGLAS